MIRPDKKLEKQLNSLGIFFRDEPETFTRESRRVIGVRVEIALAESAEVTAPTFGLRTVSPRGVIVNVGDWETLKRGEIPVLAFNAIMPMPEGIYPPGFAEAPLQYAQSFPDLCWQVGVEPKPAEAPPLPMPLAEGAEYTDLGWYLPGRMVDHLIDSLGKLNDVFLDGTLTDAILYGILRR